MSRKYKESAEPDVGEKQANAHQSRQEEETVNEANKMITKCAPQQAAYLTTKDKKSKNGTSTPVITKKRQRGSAKGQILYISPNFNDPLDDFDEYS